MERLEAPAARILSYSRLTICVWNIGSKSALSQPGRGKWCVFRARLRLEWKHEGVSLPNRSLRIWPPRSGALSCHSSRFACLRDAACGAECQLAKPPRSGRKRRLRQRRELQVPRPVEGPVLVPVVLQAAKPACRAAAAVPAAKPVPNRRHGFVRHSLLPPSYGPWRSSLMSLRTPSAFAGVANYAPAHSGDAAAAAYLSLGFAYQQEKRYGDAASALRQAKQASEVLDDYADYLGAVSEHASGNDSAAEALLKGFDDRYPDSIFVVDAPVLEASVLLAAGNTAGAKQVLDGIAGRGKRHAEVRAGAGKGSGGRWAKPPRPSASTRTFCSSIRLARRPSRPAPNLPRWARRAISRLPSCAAWATPTTTRALFAGQRAVSRAGAQCHTR